MALTFVTMFKVFSQINHNLLLYNYQLITLVDLKQTNQPAPKLQANRFCMVFSTWSTENPKLSRRPQVFNTKTQRTHN